MNRTELSKSAAFAKPLSGFDSENKILTHLTVKQSPKKSLIIDG